jgi:hypothetical protein
VLEEVRMAVHRHSMYDVDSADDEDGEDGEGNEMFEDGSFDSGEVF